MLLVLLLLLVVERCTLKIFGGRGVAVINFEVYKKPVSARATEEYRRGNF
jgi:hypothetical protein